MKCMLCELANSLSSKRIIKLVKIVKQQQIKVSRNWPEDRRQTEKHFFKKFYRVSVRTVAICDIWARNCSHHLSPTSYYIFQKVFSGWTWPRRDWLPSPQPPSHFSVIRQWFPLGWWVAHSQPQDVSEDLFQEGAAKQIGSPKSIQLPLIV